MKTTDRKEKKAQSPRIGIRGRVLLYLMLFVLFVLALLWVFQLQLLGAFYRAYKRQQVGGAAEVVVQNLANEELDSLAQRLAEQNEVNILLLDSSQTQLLSAQGTRGSMVHKMAHGTLKWWCSQAPADGSPSEHLFFIDQTNYVVTGTLPAGLGSSPQGNAGPGGGRSGGTAAEGEQNGGAEPPPAPQGEGFGRERDPQDIGRQRESFNSLGLENDEAMGLLYLRRVTMPDGTPAVLLLSAQITPVNATTSALRLQLIVITALILVFALLLAWLISRRISRPIIETNTAAKSLSRAQYERPPHAAAYREIAELNTTLAQAAEDLGQVEALQHELIANISHDLRTPLTMIGGYAEVMRDLPNENTPENMQIIIDETQRLSSLVNELLDFSRMQTGSITLNPTDFCLTETVQAIVGRIGSMVAKDGYQIVFTPADAQFVTADAPRIEQVVYNLIGNALTYTGADKTVTLTQTLRGRSVRIEVRDTGKGIAKDELPLIWNRYYRTKETHKRAIIGSGLGLNIVRSILEMHGVPYGVDSEEGKGTAFWFELPLADLDEADEA